MFGWAIRLKIQNYIKFFAQIGKLLKIRRFFKLPIKSLKWAYFFKSPSSNLLNFCMDSIFKGLFTIDFKYNKKVGFQFVIANGVFKIAKNGET